MNRSIPHPVDQSFLQAAAVDLVPRLEDEVLNGHDGTGGATALHYAAAAGYADLCWELLETPHFFVLNEQDCQVCAKQKKTCCWVGLSEKIDFFFVGVK